MSALPPDAPHGDGQPCASGRVTGGGAPRWPQASRPATDGRVSRAPAVRPGSLVARCGPCHLPAHGGRGRQVFRI